MGREEEEGSGVHKHYLGLVHGDDSGRGCGEGGGGGFRMGNTGIPVVDSF